MKPVDDSLFAVLRMVTVMINIDGRIVPEEQKWFEHLMRTCSLTQEQERQLVADLRSPPAIKDVCQFIRLAEDRERLMRLARIAMRIDGHVDPREQELLDCLLDLNRQDANEMRKYAGELIKHTERLAMWESLEELGRGLRARRGPFGGWIVDPPSIRETKK